MGDAGVPTLRGSPSALPTPNPTESFWQASHPNPVTNHRSTSDLPSDANIVVIGTGITGTFAVDELLSKTTGSRSSAERADILVLEARTTCSAATGRNGGHLVPLVHEQRPGIIAWELRNYHHVANLIDSRNIPCDFRRLNSCIGFWNLTYFEEAKAALKQALALAPAQTSSEVRVVEDKDELEHGLNLIDAVGALVQTTAGSLSPYKLITWLWQDMLKSHEESGRLNLQTNTPVTSITTTSTSTPEYLVHTDRGTVRAQRVILATNAYTSHLLPSFASLIIPRQAQMTALKPPASSPFSRTLIPKSYGFLGVQGMDREMSDYLVQSPILKDGQGGQFMYGGGRQNAIGNGNYVSDDSYVDPNVETYLRSLPRRLDLLSGNLDSENLSKTSRQLLELEASWTGIIGSSADGHPWVGGVPDHPGLFIAAGYSGHGMPNAPLSGRHIAKLVLESLKPNGNWEQVEQDEIELQNSLTTGTHAGLPREYVVTKERISKILESD